MADPKPRTAPAPVAQFFNVMQVRHTSREFFFDFGQFAGRASPGAEFQEVTLISSLVTTPTHAKAILDTLKVNLRKYEEKFGEIPSEGEAPPKEVTH